MARKINVPGVGEVEVPSSATDAEIIQFAQKVQEAGSVKAAYEKAVAERPGAFMSGVYGAGADISALLSRATQEAGLNPAVDFSAASEALGQKAAQYTPTIGDYKNIGGIGDAFTYLGELAAQSAPRMIATGAAAYLGGPRAGFAVGAPMFAGSNLRRQAEEQNIPLSETQLGPAVGSAIPQAALELIPFEGRLFQMFKSASEPVKRSIAREIVSRIPGTAASEALTETSQQALEILQANPDKLLEMDDETVNELINAAVGGAVLGGVLGAGSSAIDVRSEKKREAAVESFNNLKDTIQKEADEGRSIDLRSETNLGVEALQLKQASPNLEIKPIKKVIEDDKGNKQEVNAFTIRDLGDKTKGKVNIGEFANEDAAKQAVAAYQAIVAKPAATPPAATQQPAPEAPQPGINLKPTVAAKKPVQPPLPAEATTTPPGVGKAASELPSVPERPVPEAPATFEKQREALQRETRAAMLYNATDKVPPKLVNPRIKRIKLDDGRTIDFNRTKFTEAQVRDAVANNRLNEILELGPFNREEAVASELRGNAPVAVVERTPDGVEVKAAAGTTETAPAQVQALEQTKTAPENKVVVEPVQDLVAGRLAPELTADERVAIWKSVAPQAESFRDLTPIQQEQYFAKLKVAQDARSAEIKKKLSASPAGELSTQPVPAVAVLASRPELADKVGETLKKRLSSMGLGKVAIKIQTAVKSGEFGRYGQGAYDPATKTIEISLSAVDPKATDEEFIARLSEIVDHEAIHAVVDLGVLTKEEFSSLLQKAGTTKYPGSSFTYLERAFATYAPMLKNPDGTVDRLAVSEEAVAEMFRDWNAGRLKVEEKPRGLFTRIREFFRRVRAASNDAGFAKVFEEIKSGEVAARTPSEAKAAGDKKFAIPARLTGESEQEFKQWWKQSKAVDRNGKPQVFYHGRPRPLREGQFNRGASGALPGEEGPYYFSPKTWFADLYATRDMSKGGDRKVTETGTMYPVFLSVQNPWDYNNPRHVDDVVEYIANGLESGKIDLSELKLTRAGVPSAASLKRIGIFLEAGDWDAVEVPAVQRAIRDLGFDGFYLVEEDVRNLAVYKPQQIKSIYNQFEPGTAESRKLSIAPRSVLPAETASVSTANLLWEASGPPLHERFKGGFRSLIEAGQYITDLYQALRDSSGQPLSLTDYSPKSRKIIRDTLVAEGIFALNDSTSAIGWYDRKLKYAYEIMSLIRPELRTDANAKSIFDFALAVTSNGMAVVGNFKEALRQYDYYRKNGRFDEVGIGKQGSAMEQSFRFFNKYAPIYGVDGLTQVLNTKFTVKELRDMGLADSSSELPETEVFGSYVLGPKIGQGFYQNIRGNYSTLTMDRWFMRMWNRITGNPFAERVAEAKMQSNREFIRNSIIANKSKDDDTVLRDASKRFFGDEDYKKHLQKLKLDTPSGRDTMDEFTLILERRYQSFWTRTKKATGKNPEKSDMFKRVGSHYSAVVGELQEDPRGPEERKIIREIVTEAVDELNKLGYNITMADFQALLWYPEKRLWKERFGVKPGQGEDNDYADAATIVAKENGVKDNDIKAAIASVDRGIASGTYVAAGAGQSGGANAQAGLGAGERKSFILDQIGRKLQRLVGGRYNGEDGLFQRTGGSRDRNAVKPAKTDKHPVTRSPVLATFSVGGRGKWLKSLGVATKKIYELDPDIDAAAFRDLVARAAANSSFGTAVTIKTVEELSAPDMRLFLSEDGTYGFALSGNDIVSVFSDPKSENKNTAVTMLELAKQEGGQKLDCYDTMLPIIYGRAGFQGVARLAFDDSQANPEWFDESGDPKPQFRSFKSRTIKGDRGIGRPDLLFMVYRNAEEGYRPEQAKVVTDYGDGLEAQDQAITEQVNRKYSLAPAYNNVKQFTQADVDKVIEGLSYGAVIDSIQGFFGNKYVKKFVPERFRPSRQSTSNLISLFADRMISVGEMIDYIRKNGGKVTDAMDTYMQEDLMRGRVNVDLSARKDGIYKNLIDYIESSGVKLKATEEEAKRGDYGLEDYLYARHAKERNQRIRDIGNKDPEKGSGMTDAEADEILAAVDRNPKKKEILEAAKLFDKIIEDTNRVRIEAGLTPDFSAMEVIDEDGNKVIADMRIFQHYAPLRGFLEENPEYGVNSEEELRARVGAGFSVRGREDKRAMGRKSRASDIVAHAIIQNSQAVIRAAKNRVNNSLIQLVKENPKQAEEFGIRILKKAPTKAIINKNGVIQTMVDQNYAQRPDILVVKAMPGIAPEYKGGDQVIFEVSNEALQKALITKKVAGPDTAEKILRVTQAVNRWMAMMNTGLNPEFMLVNFPRDLQTAIINIEQYKTPGLQKKMSKDVFRAARGAWNVIRNPDAKGFWEDAFRDFQQHGGMTAGFSGVQGIEESIRQIGKMINDPKKGNYNQRALQAAKATIGILEDANSAVENAIRLSVYKNLVDAGFTKERAAQAAKNLTVNFDKRGELGPVLNSLYLFFNASIQGTLSMAMAAARSPRVKKMLGGIVVLGLVQDIINSLFSPEDEDGKSVYDKIPDYKLRTSFIIMDPFGITERGYLAIPMPYGYNAFHNLGRSLSRRLRGEYSTLEATNNIMGTFVDAFNPIGGTENFFNAISPTVLDPFVSAFALNEDFTGRKIYPDPFPGSVPKADSHTHWDNVSPIFKSITQFLNSATGGSEYVPGMIDFSPEVMEYFFNYALGGAGAFVIRTLETPTNVIIPAFTGDLDEIELNDIPVFRKLVGNVTDRVVTEGYITNANYLLSRGKELDAALKSGDAARIKETREKYREELKVYPRVKALVNRRNKIASDLKKLRDNPRVPENQKRLRVDQMQKQIVEITAEVNKIYEKIADEKSIGIF